MNDYLNADDKSEGVESISFRADCDSNGSVKEEVKKLVPIIATFKTPEKMLRPPVVNTPKYSSRFDPKEILGKVVPEEEKEKIATPDKAIPKCKAILIQDIDAKGVEGVTLLRKENELEVNEEEEDSTPCHIMIQGAF